ncbi:MAG: 50S ribosomal protein P1 [Thermoprotei archaeon]|nr:MAG: 50S ribosomal protein P1 [Thermoprotei archaeon]
MEYVYASLILHHAGKPITEENIKKILESAGIQVDDVRVKALVATLKEVNIDEALKTAATMPATVAAPSAPQETPEKEEEEEKKKEEEKKEEEEVAEGLSALFG